MSLLKAHGDKDQPRYSYDVCIVVSSLEIGGAERAAINLAKALTDSGMSVHLIVLGAHGPLSSLVDNRVATTYLESMSARRSIRPLRAELRRNPARSCIGEDLHIGLLVAYATAGLQTKAFVHDHSDPIQRARSTPTGIRSALWLGLKMAALIGQIERYVACSEGAARSARLYFGLRKHQVSYVFNPVVASVDDATLDGHCGSTFDVVVVCRLVAGKRVDWILHAVNQLDRPIRVCIIGDGPNRPGLEGLVRVLNMEKNVTFAGELRDPYQLMARGEILVLASEREGMSLVLVEALSLGLKVVATDCPSGPREVLKNGAIGWLCPPGDIDQLAIAIADALDSPQKAGVDEAIAAFTPQAIATEWRGIVSMPLYDGHRPAGLK